MKRVNTEDLLVAVTGYWYVWFEREWIRIQLKSDAGDSLVLEYDLGISEAQGRLRWRSSMDSVQFIDQKP